MIRVRSWTRKPWPVNSSAKELVSFGILEVDRMVEKDAPKVNSVKKSFGRTGPPILDPKADKLALRRKKVDFSSPVEREKRSLAPAGVASMCGGMDPRSS